MLERDEGKESWDEDEDDEDPDGDEMKGTSALFLQGQKSWRNNNLFFVLTNYNSESIESKTRVLAAWNNHRGQWTQAAR